jgi:hypothetical protein
MIFHFKCLKIIFRHSTSLLYSGVCSTINEANPMLKFFLLLKFVNHDNSGYDIGIYIAIIIIAELCAIRKIAI